MNLSEKIAALFDEHGKEVPLFEAKVKRCLFFKNLFRFRKGYLSITNEEDCWSVLWTNGGTTHNPLEGPAYCFDVRKKDGKPAVSAATPTGVWKTALHLWPVRDRNEAAKIIRFMERMINLGYQDMIRTT